MKRIVKVRKHTREGYKVKGPIKVNSHTREIEVKKASSGSSNPIIDFSKKQEENFQKLPEERKKEINDFRKEIESIDYNKILTPTNKRIIEDSVKGAIYEGNEQVALDSDRMISLFSDTLTTKQYSNLNREKAEEVLFSYANDLFEKQKELNQNKKEPFSIESLKSDIPAQTIENGYRNISFTPEKRVDLVQGDYARDVKDLYDELLQVAPEEKEQIEEDIQRFKENYRTKYISWLGALGNTASTMITGGSGFNVRKNQKKQGTEERRYQELRDFKEKVSKKLKSKYKKDGPIKGNDPDAITKLKDKLAKEQSEKEEMKRINAIFKKNGKLTKEDFKSQELFERAKSNLKFSYDNKPFPSFELTNANGRIKNIKERVESLSKKKERGNKEYLINGIKVVEDVEDNRLRLFFDGIPPVEQRNKLKSNGFRWSPYNSAWQRQLTPNAIYTTKQILEDFS